MYSAWIDLVIAGLLEMVWATSLKYTHGMTRLWPTVFTLVAMAGSVWFLSLAVRVLPLGTAYAVWTGIGAVSIAIIGILFMGESVTFVRLFCIGLILSGVIGLKIFS